MNGCTAGLTVVSFVLIINWEYLKHSISGSSTRNVKCFVMTPQEGEKHILSLEGRCSRRLDTNACRGASHLWCS